MASAVPGELSLRAQPNPTRASMELNVQGATDAVVSLVIYDVGGRVVRTLVRGTLRTPTVAWDGRDDRGRDVESGIYFCRLVSGGHAVTEKVVIVAP